jgi:hypothetical protein
MDTIGGPVLASELGREYFVNNAALRNPAVFNHVQAIDNIVRARQFREGGFTDAPSTTATPTAPADTLTPLLPLLAEMSALLRDLRDREFEAVIRDNTITSMRKREQPIQRFTGK